MIYTHRYFKVAEELEQIEIAQIWEILKLLYSVQKQKKPKNVKEKSFLWDNYSGNIIYNLDFIYIHILYQILFLMNHIMVNMMKCLIYPIQMYKILT